MAAICRRANGWPPSRRCISICTTRCGSIR
jgi:hypothetical protein